MRMNHFVFLASVVLLFAACSNDDSYVDFLPKPSENLKSISFVKHYDGNVALLEKESFHFGKDGTLSQYISLRNTAGKEYVSTSNLTRIDTVADKQAPYYYTYDSWKNNTNLYESRYYLSDYPSVCTYALKVTAGSENSTHAFLMKYIYMDNKPYISEIRDMVRKTEKEYYRLEWDYSKFKEGEITVRNFLMDELKYTARLTIEQRDNLNMADVQYLDYHPINKHYELLYSGFLGTFDYVITQQESDNDLYIPNQSADYTFTKEGLPLQVVLTPAKEGKQSVRYNFEYEWIKK